MTLALKGLGRYPELREAYFGQLLKDHTRAIQVLDRFPLTETTGATICGRDSSHDSELSASAMKPSMLVAV